MISTVKVGRNIFIPSDCANFSLEIVIIIEKILSEYYTKVKEENFQVPAYRILLCNYCSNKVVEDVKTQIEWMCTEISKQFYNFNENPFSFQYLECVNDLQEYYEKKKDCNHIIVASNDSLDLGFSNVNVKINLENSSRSANEPELRNIPFWQRESGLSSEETDTEC